MIYSNLEEAYLNLTNVTWVLQMNIKPNQSIVHFLAMSQVLKTINSIEPEKFIAQLVLME